MALPALVTAVVMLSRQRFEFISLRRLLRTASAALRHRRNAGSELGLQNVRSTDPWVNNDHHAEDSSDRGDFIEEQDCAKVYL